ncbi:MAG: biopolymer transporter ExbD [Pseudomonadota bacterium]
MRYRVESENRINLTPMLDVVFIMLIFFVVTATFVNEQGLDLSAPEPRIKPPDQKEKTSVLVRIEANNQLIVQGKFSDPRTIRAHLERLHAQNPEAPLVIDAHPNSSAESTVLVIDSARASGIENIAFAEIAI